MLRRGVRNTVQIEPDLKICGEVVNGQEAVDKAKELNPDLVILDINMPVLDGLVVVRQILRHRPAIKVVVLLRAQFRSNFAGGSRRGSSRLLVKRSRCTRSVANRERGAQRKNCWRI
jgi:DNA-binding NarL/FixJ family response regulator